MRRLAGVLTGLLLTSAAATAHHGYDDFFREKRVSVEGVLEGLDYANPHVVLKIRTDDGQLYTALWEGLTGVERRGGAWTSLTVGERVMVIGSPPRDPASRDIALLRQVTRLRDGWTWRTE
jgi:hypothetical protein